MGKTARHGTPLDEAMTINRGSRQHRILVASPNPGDYVTQVARAFHETSALHSFLTGLAITEDSRLLQPLRLFFGDRIKNRIISGLPKAKVKSQWRAHVPLPSLHHEEIDTTLRARNERWSEAVITKYAHKALAAAEPPTAVYAYENSALPLFKAAKSQGIPCILDLPSLDNREVLKIHLDEFDNLPAHLTARWRHTIKHFESRQLARDLERRLADIIVTNSSLTAESHQRAGVPAKKILTVPLACPPTSDKANSNPGEDGQRPKSAMILAGTLSLQKGARQLADAMNALEPSAQFSIDHFGSVQVPTSYLEANSHWLRLRGRVSRENLQVKLSEYSALVLPTLSDGFGLVVGEALAAGTPVLCSKYAGACCLLENGINGFIFDPRNPRQFRETLLRVHQTKRMEAMRSNCLATARTWQWPDYRAKLAESILSRLDEL